MFYLGDRDHSDRQCEVLLLCRPSPSFLDWISQLGQIYPFSYHNIQIIYFFRMVVEAPMPWVVIISNYFTIVKSDFFISMLFQGICHEFTIEYGLTLSEQYCHKIFDIIRLNIAVTITRL